MKRLFEILLVTTIFFIILYFLSYFFYFDSLCSKFSGKNETNLAFVINKIATCKDSLVCYPNNITTNEKNEVNNWDCMKKDSPVLGADLYISIYNYLKNNLIK